MLYGIVLILIRYDLPIFYFLFAPNLKKFHFKTDVNIILASSENEHAENIIARGGIIYENKSFKIFSSFST